MSTDDTENDELVAETKVLAIASHVTYGYVGNTMAKFVMQTLGCEVAAINTVNFSNHLGYRRFKGTRTPSEEIQSLYTGLRNAYLNDFDVLLSGYIPSIETLNVVSSIAQDLRSSSLSSSSSTAITQDRPNTNQTPNSRSEFFWILDPVMGDQGRLYVNADLVQGYRATIRKADLILPNQFELEILTDIPIGTEPVQLSQITTAITVLHSPPHNLNHVVVTSVRIHNKPHTLSVIGSSATTTGKPRLFIVEVPVLNCFFSGTGDMFAGLMVGRLSDECRKAGVTGRKGWVSDDSVSAEELPLAKATCRVLSSMGMVLEKTMKVRNREMELWEARVAPGLRGEIDLKKKKKNHEEEGEGSGDGDGDGDGDADDNGSGDVDDFEMREYLAGTKAAEVRVVRYARDLVCPEDRYKAVALQV